MLNDTTVHQHLSHWWSFQTKQISRFYWVTVLKGKERRQNYVITLQKLESSQDQTSTSH